MAYYINKLSNGDPLPVKGKAEFLLANVEGSKIVCVDEPNLPGVRSYLPCIDLFEDVPDLVCVAQLAGYDVACVIDIPRQLEICRQGNDHCRIIWLMVPGAAQMAGVPSVSRLTDLQRANAQFRYAWPILLIMSVVAWPAVHLYFDRYPGGWALWGLLIGYLYKHTRDGYDKIKKL